LSLYGKTRRPVYEPFGLVKVFGAKAMSAVQDSTIHESWSWGEKEAVLFSLFVHLVVWCAMQSFGFKPRGHQSSHYLHPPSGTVV
jgi:hypothetical protein